MLASVLLSEASGSLSQLPVLLGGLKPQLFPSSIIRSVISKLDDDTVEGVVGYSSPIEWHLKPFSFLGPAMWIFLESLTKLHANWLEGVYC